MRWRPAYDPRESPKHRALLQTRSTLAYLPFALRWAVSPGIWSMAVIYGLVIGLFSGTLTGMWLVILASCGVIAWLLAVQSRSVFGFGDPPLLSAQELVTVGRGAILVIGMLLVLLMLYGALRAYAPGMAYLGAWAIGALLPSMFVLVAVEDSVFSAFAPHRVLRILIFGGPVGWLVAVASAWGLGGALETLAQMVGQQATAEALVAHAPSVGKVLGPVVLLWGSALLLHLNGHALHHRHEIVGLGTVFAAADGDELAQRRSEDAVRKRIAAIERATTAHDTIALDRLCAQLAPEGTDPVVFEELLWRELLFHRQYAASVRVAKPLLTAVIAAKRYALAKEVWLEVKRHSPSFDPGDDVRARFKELATAHRDQRMVDAL